ncbi:hypothetical protein NL676_016613 [Syzygium grande]|nr:hypothetical protein NL676_016613 [Syzygium grande]
MTLIRILTQIASPCRQLVNGCHGTEVQIIKEPPAGKTNFTVISRNLQWKFIVVEKALRAGSSQAVSFVNLLAGTDCQ